VHRPAEKTLWTPLAADYQRVHQKEVISRKIKHVRLQGIDLEKRVIRGRGLLSCEI
jgi:hypothetical protein